MQRSFEYRRLKVIEPPQSPNRFGVRAFCQEQGVGDNSFYYWRKRLQKSAPVQFALLKTVVSGAPLELILCNGEQLRIRNGVDAATFRLVLDVVRR